MFKSMGGCGYMALGVGAQGYSAAGGGVVLANGYVFGGNLYKMPYSTETYSSLGAFSTWFGTFNGDKGISDILNGCGYRCGVWGSTAGLKLYCDKVVYASDTVSHMGDLPFRAGANGGKSATTGYIVGPSCNDTADNVCLKTSLTSYGWSMLVSKLAATTRGLTCTETAAAIYNFGSKDNRNNIEKFTFASETGAYIAATSTYGSYGSSVQSDTNSYFIEDGPAGSDFGVDKLIFATEARSQIYTTFGLTQASSHMSPLAGYWVEGVIAGTYPGGVATSKQAKILFSTEAISVGSASVGSDNKGVGFSS